MVVQNESVNESEEYFCSDCGERIEPTDARCPKCGAEFSEETQALTEDIKRGRTWSNIIISSILLFSVATSIFSVIYNVQTLSQILIRFALLIILIYYFYRGYNFARLTMIALIAIGGVYGIISGILLLSKSWMGIWLILYGTVFIIYSILFVKIKFIKLFQEYQRRIKER